MSSRALASRDWRRPPEPDTSAAASTQTASRQQQETRGASAPSWNHRSSSITPSVGPPQDAGHRARWHDPNQASRQPGPTHAGHAGNANHSAQTHSQQNIDYTKRIYLGNLLYCARQEDIAGLLGDAEVAYTNMVISIDPFTSRNPSYCFVDFATAQEALDAIASLHGRPLLGRPVKTRPAVPAGRGAFNPDFAKKPTRAMRDGWLPAPPEIDESGNLAGDPGIFKRWERDDASDFFSPDDSDHHGFAIIAISKIIPPAPGLEHYGHLVYVQLDSKAEAQRAADALHQTIPPWGGLQRVWVRVSTSSGSWKTHQRSGLLELEASGMLAV